jgi:hypothetical protein
MKLQNNLSRTFLFLVMFIGAVMFCTAQETGINIGGWLGFGGGGGEYEDSSVHGGIDLELRLFNIFGIQTGIAILQDSGYLFDEPMIANTIIQIPVLANINLNFFIYFMSIYAGVGVNLSSTGEDNITIRSFSKFSYILGGKFGIFMPFDYYVISFFMGYQYNWDVSDTTYRYMGNRFKYLGERSIISVGLSFLIPF